MIGIIKIRTFSKVKLKKIFTKFNKNISLKKCYCRLWVDDSNAKLFTFFQSSKILFLSIFNQIKYF